MTMNKNLDRPFLTQDMNLAAFLCYKGMTLLSAAPAEESGRRKFILVDREDREQLVEQWVAGVDEGLICKLYAAKLRMVRRALHEGAQ